MKTLIDLIPEAAGERSAEAFRRQFGANVTPPPVSPRLQVMAEQAKTSTEEAARARRNARQTSRAYWSGYTHAVRETSLIDGMVLTVTFLAGFGMALISIGALA